MTEGPNYTERSAGKVRLHNEHKCNGPRWSDAYRITEMSFSQKTTIHSVM